MNTTYAIEIFDKDGHSIGKLLDATNIDIIKYIDKGFVVVDKSHGNNHTFTKEEMTNTVGVSDGLIDIG